MFICGTYKNPKGENITSGKVVCDYKPHKKEKERVRLTVGATGWTTPAMSQLPLRTSQHSKSSSTTLSPQNMRP
jgi:hypothetical protein